MAIAIQSRPDRAVGPRHPRDLVENWVIEHLITRAERRGHDRDTALRLIDLMLVFITCTTAYAPFCTTVAGRFIHHRPIVNDDITSGRAHTRTIAAMRRTGLPLDDDFLVASPTCMNTCNHPCHDSDTDD